MIDAYIDYFFDVTPAKAGAQCDAPLDSGVRRNDELNLVANQIKSSQDFHRSMTRHTGAQPAECSLPH